MLRNSRGSHGLYDPLLIVKPFNEEFGRVLLEEPVLIPFGILTQHRCLDGGLASLLVELLDLSLPPLDLLLDFLHLSDNLVLLIGELSDLLLDPLAVHAARALQLLLEIFDLGEEGLRVGEDVGFLVLLV